MNSNTFKRGIILTLAGLLHDNKPFKEEFITCTRVPMNKIQTLEFLGGVNLADFRLKGEATNIPYYQLNNLYIDARQIEIAYINHLNRK